LLWCKCLEVPVAPREGDMTAGFRLQTWGEVDKGMELFIRGTLKEEHGSWEGRPAHGAQVQSQHAFKLFRDVNLPQSEYVEPLTLECQEVYAGLGRVPRGIAGSVPIPLVDGLPGGSMIFADHDQVQRELLKHLLRTGSLTGIQDGKT
jgi:hypothetical protein